MTPILVVLYIIPAVSLLLLPLHNKFEYGRIHFIFGRSEWVLSFFRDMVLTPFLFCYAIYLLAADITAFLPPIFYFLLVALSIWAYLNRRRRVKAFLDYIVAGPVIEPAVFFRLYYATVSGLPGNLPKEHPPALKSPLDYSSGSHSVTIWPVMPGLVYTAALARMVVRASKWGDGEYCMALADILGTIWGAEIVRLIGARLEIKGAEDLDAVSGRSIFVCDHKSFFDFIIVPLTLGLVGEGRKERFRPRYMAARDHFYDNPLLYRVVGLGRAMEKIGTVFVDRKAKKESARKAVDDAVEAIVRDDVDIVIFPQGTRARGRTGLKGERLDAGYYTTGREEKLLKPRGHLKKGAAYLAVDSSDQLSKRGIPLNIIPVGLLGTGVVAPRGGSRIQKGVSIIVTFGRPLTLDSKPAGDRVERVEGVHARIDEMLKGVVGINANLKKRLTIDAGKMMKDEDVDRFLEALDAWSSDQDLIFSIVDCIYTLPGRMRAPFLRRLGQLIVETDTPMDEILNFKRSVVREMLGHG